MSHEVWILPAEGEQAEASRGLAALSSFARNFSHEINSPLAAAMSEIGFVATRRGSEEERGRALAAALESLAKVRRIVERAQRLGQEIEGSGACPLDVVVRAAIEPLLPLVMLRGAHLELDLKSTRPLENAGRMGPVVAELVTNAVRAVAAGGTIVVRLRQLARRALLTVRDDGCGIPARTRRRVFEPFYGERSAGLGLPLCHSVVSSLGGTFDIESRGGGGTEVVISLPVSARP